VARHAADIALHTLLPERCLACGAIVGEGALCATCWESMNFVAAPLCERCGQPFEIDPRGGALCGACLANPPGYARARAVFRYDAASRPLVLRFKHADRTGAAGHYARWMARAGAELLAEAEVVVPVPLHRWRLWRRRYNQSALLALALARLAGVPSAPDALRRARATQSQGPLGRAQRRRNVQGAFRLAHPAAVAGRRVLLIDDVLTSGATVEECARVLRRGGATEVDVLTLARVVLAPDYEIADEHLYS
jgi:ComF family protein